MEISKMQCPICTSHAKLFLENCYDDRFGYPGNFALSKCIKCDHIALDAQFTEAQLTDLYSNYYPRSSFAVENYQPHNENSPFLSWFNGEYRAVSAVPENVRVLDIGCGFAETLGYHKNRGCEAYGVEADENIRKVAERFGFNVQVGVFNETMFQPGFFDFVTMDQVLEHALDPIKTMFTVKNILKDNGKLIITVPNAFGWGAKFYKNKWLHWHCPYHLQFFSKKSLKLAAAKVGFKVNKIKTITSSEWLFYQKIHNTVFPKMGDSSFFFSPKKNWGDAPQFAIESRSQVTTWHKRKLNHLITRFFDFLGFGDNLFIEFEKINK
jgi:SAM-dependent methyltransferase